MTTELFKFGARRPLPGRRTGYRQESIVGGRKIILCTDEYENGTLGGISIEMPKAGVAFSAVLTSVAEAVSLGLQHGVPLDLFVDTYTFTRFDPAGMVEGNASITSCTSILDYVFRDLAIHYLDRNEFASPAPEESNEQGASVTQLRPAANEELDDEIPF